MYITDDGMVAMFEECCRNSAIDYVRIRREVEEKLGRLTYSFLDVCEYAKVVLKEIVTSGSRKHTYYATVYTKNCWSYEDVIKAAEYCETLMKKDCNYSLFVRYVKYDYDEMAESFLKGDDMELCKKINTLHEIRDFFKRCLREYEAEQNADALLEKFMTRPDFQPYEIRRHANREINNVYNETIKH